MLLFSSPTRFGLPLLISLMVLSACLPSQLWAQQGESTAPLNLARIVDQAENVVLARVTGVAAEPHPQFTNLDTVVVSLEVLEVLKGSPGKQLTFREYVFDPRDRDSLLGYRVGEEVVLCLRKPSPYGLSSPIGLEQGRFRVERDAANNRVLRNGFGNAALFDGVENSAPGLQQRLSASVQRLISEQHSGPVSFDQFKSFVQSLTAAHLAAQ
jgi:hypothetical protein